MNSEHLFDFKKLKLHIYSFQVRLRYSDFKEFYFIKLYRLIDDFIFS